MENIVSYIKHEITGDNVYVLDDDCALVFEDEDEVYSEEYKIIKRTPSGAHINKISKENGRIKTIQLLTRNIPQKEKTRFSKFVGNYIKDLVPLMYGCVVLNINVQDAILHVDTNYGSLEGTDDMLYFHAWRSGFVGDREETIGCLEIAIPIGVDENEIDENNIATAIEALVTSAKDIKWMVSDKHKGEIKKMFSWQEIAIGFFYDEKSARAYADLIGEKAFVVEI